MAEELVKTEEEKKKEEAKYAVDIISRDFISVYPKLREEHRQVLVTYETEELPPATVTIDLFNLFKEKQFEAEKQIKERKGPLAEEYFTVEKKKIREDIETRVAFVPERVVV